MTTTVEITEFAGTEPWLADAIKRVEQATAPGAEPTVLDRGDLVKVLNAAKYAHIYDEIV